jgi:hypothetical protein
MKFIAIALGFFISAISSAQFILTEPLVKQTSGDIMQINTSYLKNLCVATVAKLSTSTSLIKIKGITDSSEIDQYHYGCIVLANVTETSSRNPKFRSSNKTYDISIDIRDGKATILQSHLIEDSKRLMDSR